MGIATNSRRDFIKKSAVVCAGTPFVPKWMISKAKSDHHELKIHLFSKHLQFLDYNEMAERAAEAGFDGLDLTVRKGGHVEPERVTNDLPKAVNAIRKAGMKSIMMATNINNSESQQNRRVLETAAEQDIKYYRLQYYKYLDEKSIPESIVHYQDSLNELGEFNENLGMVGCYQNHAGTRMGSSIWELYALMMEAGNDGIGAQYDIRHATVEGGLNWSKGLELIRPRIQSIVLKDFKWSQKSNGEWHPENVPLGEGMVDWDKYFKILKSYKLNVPVSLHLEYPLGGAEKGRKELSVNPQVVYDAMKRDLTFARKMWDKA